MDLQLSAKTALVTGSERGTGEVIARALAAEGVRVVLHCNREAALDALVDAAAALANDAIAVCGDIRSDEGAAQVVEAIRAQGITIDILVNNYGTGSLGTWSGTSTDDWLDMYQTNVLSGMRMSRAFFDDMKARQWGRIINLGTIGSHQPNAIMPHYYASKGALATAGVSLAKELSHTGITVNTVSPGLIHTEEVEAAFRKRAKKEGWGDDWQTIVDNVTQSDYPNPCGRIATREEVASLVVYLCSPVAGYINGQNIRIDGGAVSYV